MRCWLIGALSLLMGCATAAEDPYASPFGPASKDAEVATDTTSPAKDSSTPTPKDSGSTPAMDTSVEPPDTSTEPDTYTEPPDTWTEPPDTSVFDTGPPPFDTGPTGGMCNWCSTGSCSSLFVDYACLLDCLSAGHLDCDYNPANPMPCTCVD